MATRRTRRLDRGGRRLRDDGRLEGVDGHGEPRIVERMIDPPGEVATGAAVAQGSPVATGTNGRSGHAVDKSGMLHP
jgi:hypothetical protein